MQKKKTNKNMTIKHICLTNIKENKKLNKQSKRRLLEYINSLDNYSILYLLINESLPPKNFNKEKVLTEFNYLVESVLLESPRDALLASLARKRENIKKQNSNFNNDPEYISAINKAAKFGITNKDMDEWIKKDNSGLYNWSKKEDGSGYEWIPKNKNTINQNQNKTRQNNSTTDNSFEDLFKDFNKTYDDINSQYEDIKKSREEMKKEQEKRDKEMKEEIHRRYRELKEKGQKKLKTAKKVTTNVLSVALILSTLYAAGRIISKRYLSQASKNCSNKSFKEKSKCMKEYKIKSLEEQLDRIKIAINKCDNSNNPTKCRMEIYKTLRKKNEELNKIKNSKQQWI